MKATILLLFICYFNFSFGQNSLDEKGRKQGIWIKKFPQSNAIDYTGQFKDDQPFGTFIYYFPSGKKKAEINYISSKITYTIMYHDNEVILAQGKFINQQKDSTWTMYAKSGKISIVENYKLGQLDGERLVYYPLGNSETKKDQLTQKQVYLNGKLHGKQLDYFENGKIWKECNYLNGLKNGEEITYSPYGTIELKDYFFNGVKNGWCLAYDSIGSQVVGKVYYKLGERLDSIATIKYLAKVKIAEQKKKENKTQSKIVNPKQKKK
jgi:antitoxin component YwqK of YwqJK toxin-antitoxin module